MTKNITHLTFIVACFLLASCSSTYQMVRVHGNSPEVAQKHTKTASKHASETIVSDNGAEAVATAVEPVSNTKLAKEHITPSQYKNIKNRVHVPLLLQYAAKAAMKSAKGKSLYHTVSQNSTEYSPKRGTALYVGIIFLFIGILISLVNPLGFLAILLGVVLIVIGFIREQYTSKRTRKS